MGFVRCRMNMPKTKIRYETSLVHVAVTDTALQPGPLDAECSAP